jgi:hypothetical protein
MTRRGHASAPRRFRIAVCSAAGALFKGVRGARSVSSSGEANFTAALEAAGRADAVIPPNAKVAITRSRTKMPEKDPTGSV